MKLIRTLQLNLIVWRLWDAARQQNDRQTVS